MDYQLHTPHNLDEVGATLFTNDDLKFAQLTASSESLVVKVIML